MDLGSHSAGGAQFRSKLRRDAGRGPAAAWLFATAFALMLFSLSGSAWGAIVPFNPAQPTVFVAQGSPTQLEAAMQSGGAITFTPVGGTVSGLTYNAIGYDTCNNFIYGVQTSAANGQPAGVIIQVAGDGSISYPGITVGTGRTSGRSVQTRTVMTSTSAIAARRR